MRLLAEAVGSWVGRLVGNCIVLFFKGIRGLIYFLVGSLLAFLLFFFIVWQDCKE